MGGGTSRFVTIFVVVLAVFILIDPTLRGALGSAVGFVLMPIIGFDYRYPVLTLFLAGIVMTALTVVVRHYFTNYVEQAENQKIVSAFNKELRTARLENNTYKTKKLMEQQQAIMQKSMKSSMQQLKLMPATMIIVVPIFAWIAVFMTQLPNALVAVPWSYSVDLNAYNVFPNWVLLYSLVSIPFGQVLGRSLRYFDFKKRLGELAAGTA
jgi:uncharacterized membrane protein (DUF106 family)